MNPLLFIMGASSLKKEVAVVVGVIITLCFLPMVAVVALVGTNPVNLIFPVYNGPLDSTDEYAFGNCTYWVFLLRDQIHETIPNTWGNAATWAVRAGLDGYLVDHTPSYSAIMQISDVDGGLGHVAFVESVDPDSGAWTISEMNVKGWDVVDQQTLPASAAKNYNFIHQQEPLLAPVL